VTSEPVPWARFDDLRAGSSSLLRADHGILRADALDDVEPVLHAAQAAADEGRWAFGFVAYEAAPALDPALATHAGMAGLPLAWFGVADEPIVVPPITPSEGVGYTSGPWTCGWSRERHAEAVEAVRARIAAGDTYQVNLTTMLTGPVAGDAAALYADLAGAQGGAHHAFLDTGRFAIAGASPELFFTWGSGEVTMRPMKGTAPRGATPAQDRRAADGLRTSPKERAENVMIVDLLRNDLARVATPDGARVTALCEVETYPTVHQLVSEVTARTREGVGLVDVFRAAFPCGSVTGAPKASTMAIIRELEAGPRGVYCGAVGLVAPPGSGIPTRFAVPIRTLLVDRERGTGTYGAGGGVTWGSRAAAEYDELLVKARVLTGLTSRDDRPPHVVARPLGLDDAAGAPAAR
jgi:para-aminobenzoate synthetase/4-amino-4-deoxychorismate lyase